MKQCVMITAGVAVALCGQLAVAGLVDGNNEFAVKMYRERDFHVGAGKTVKVHMMQQSDRFRLGRDADTQALEL